MAWPADLVFQLSFAAIWAVGYLGWSYLYFLMIDPIIRRRIGTAMGIRIVWTYDARQYFQQGRYKRWSWGLANAPADHVVFAELMVHVLCVAIVNVLAGLWPVLLLYFAFVHRWIGPLALYQGLVLVVPIYSIYWAGRYRPVHAET